MFKLKNQFLFIFFLTLVIYLNSLGNNFVMDDSSMVLYNTNVHSLANLPQNFFSSPFTDPLGNSQSGGQFYRPVVTSIYSILYSLGGPKPSIFHLFQICLHAINSLFLLFLLRKFLRPNTSFVIATLFAIHPINQMTVVYISQLNDVLYMFFGLLGLIITTHDKPTLKTILFATFLLFLSLLSKESGILFVFISLLYLFLFNRQKVWNFGYIWAYFFSAYLFLRFVVAKVTYVHIPDIPIMRATLVERIYTMPKIFWFYISTFIFPSRLVSVHWWMVYKPTFTDFFLPLVAVLFLISLIFFVGHKFKNSKQKNFPLYVFFSIWFFIGMALHIQIWPLDWTVLTPWFYFPLIGLLVLMGLTWENFISPKLSPNIRNYFLTPLFIAVTLFLSAITITRNLDWKDGITLFTNDLRYEDSGYLHGALASELLADKKYQESIPHYKRAIELNPWGTPNLYNLGFAQENLGQYDEAKKNYEKFVTILPTDFGYEGLLTVIVKSNQVDSQAGQIATQAVSKFPNHPRLLLVSAVVHYQLKDPKTALALAQKSHQLRPTSDSLYILTQIQKNQPLELNK